MTTSFNVNVNDLQYILTQIKIAEASSAAYSATPKSILQAIMDAYGVTAANAAQLPAGLRTVDGTFNNLLPGRSDIGAADTLFPRLTDPNFRNVNGPGIDFNGDGIIDVSNHNYGDASVAPGTQIRSVADVDPRLISNLIVDMTSGNPAAVDAALRHSVFTGAIADADIPVAAAAIAAAYALTLSTAATAAATTPAVLAALLATVNLEIGEQFAAQTAHNNALAADTYRVPAGLAAASQAAAEAVVAAINTIGSLIFNGSINQADIDAANAAVTIAQAAVNAANAVATSLTGLTGEAAALTAASEALSLHVALVVYAGGLTIGESVGALDEIASISDAVASAESNLGFATNVTNLVTPLVDPGSLVATALGLLNTANSELAAAQLAHTNAVNAGAAVTAANTALGTTLDSYGIGHDPLGSLVIPNLSPDIGLSPGFNEWMTYFGQFFDHGLDLVTKGGTGTVYIPLQADDPLYDKGKDGIANNVVDAYFVTNPALSPVGGPLPAVSGTATTWQAFYVTDPADRSLYAPGAFAPVITATPTSFAVRFNDDGFGADGLVSTADDRPNFMALTRATVSLDANGVPQHENTTTSWIDQNQTYTSHASHQVFLREYTRIDTNGVAVVGDTNGALVPGGGLTVSTGKLIDGAMHGAIGNWGEVKAQALSMLGINLSDFDVHNAPLLLTDQYGKFIPGANGFAQLVMKPDLTHATYWFKEGNPDGSVTTAGAETTGHAFLNDIAHHAAPGKYDADGDGFKESFQVADTNPGVGDDGLASTYDDEMLNAHFITGDGRGNENIALTSVHSIFHSEHNRLVEMDKATLLGEAQAKFASTTATAAEKAAALTFLNEWLVIDVPATATAADVAALTPAGLIWDGERLFQAARFSTEMQYQHLVFEEFARRIQPMVDPFIFNSSPDIDPSIVAEFAHTVYRFGHSMLNGTVDRLDNNLDPVNGAAEQATLLAAFLNPQMYVASGTTAAEANANLIRGLSRDVGNAIDEFIVVDVRSTLLGLPLDLAALNIARGRETGIPSLNETRKQLYEGASAPVADLKPYDNWAEFGANLKNPMSLVNFIAAYGTHSTITGVTELAAKRMAAQTLIDLALADDNSTGAVDFVFGVGSYATSGLNDVDLWIGGLAEANPEFGGMLGTTFNYIFEFQMEQLQFGDRLYYLTRTQGLNILNNLEPNTFSDLVMRNTELGNKFATHLNGSLFVTPDHFLEMDTGIAQEDYNGAAAGLDPTWGAGEIHSPLTPLKVVRTLGTDTDNSNGNVADDGHLEGGTLRFTGGEHVVVGGTEGNDKIWTDKGIDTLWGDGGNDYLNAGTESDDVFGGEGDDIIEDPFGDDVLRGNQGNDVISEARGADLVFGDEGQDYIMLGQDAAEAFGGEGNDFILGGAGKDFLLGNEGDDWIEGGAGFDTIAGDNSELFFNSTVIGHDVLFHGSDEGDFDAESGDDIMGSGPSVFRYEGMFGFDWAIAKNDITGVNFDMAIPIFTTIPNDILKDRFDQVEALSGWKYGDVLEGDDRGHKGGGSSAPDSVPSELFAEHLLTQEGIDRISGLQEWMGGPVVVTDGIVTSSGARETLFAGTTGVPGSTPVTTFRDGNILLGGDGNDFLRGRGGYDLLDGDAYLNVRIKIIIPTGPNAGTYSAESMSTDKVLSGDYAGNVFNIFTAADELLNPANKEGSPNFASPAFNGATLNSLMLIGTINPGNMSIVREILDGTVGAREHDTDTAIFQGLRAEYDIEGLTVQVNLNGAAPDTISYVGTAQDLNGDGFISVRDRDTGAVGATIWKIVDGVATQFTGSSRGLLTDDTDLIKNIEQLQFADELVTIGGNNNKATGVATIHDPTMFEGKVTPYVGQQLHASSVLYDRDNDANGDGDLDDLGDIAITGVTYEWQTTEFGHDSGWSTITTDANPYTVRSVDPGHVLRAVAVFTDALGNTERVISAITDNPTAAYNVKENSLPYDASLSNAQNIANGSVVATRIPFSIDYDPESINGAPPADVDLETLHHEIDPSNNAGGRFTIIPIPGQFDFQGTPLYQIVIVNGGPVTLNYEAPVHTPANQSHQFVDNQYQVVVNTYDSPGGTLIAVRQFTILLNDVTGEVASIAPTLDLHTDTTTGLGTPGDNYATTYTENGAAVAIASGPVIGDLDSTQLMGATVKLTNAQAGDVLATVGALPAGVTVSFGPAVAGEITMYLVGPATLAAFQTAIAAVRFGNPAENNPIPGNRTINVSVSDGELVSAIATATVTVTATDDLAVANADSIITNITSGTAFVVPEWALLANDFEPDNTLDVTAVSAVNGLTVTPLAANTGSLTITDTAGVANSFTYTATGGNNSNANVTVASVNGNTTYIENFGSTSYTLNDGGWTDDWVETGDDGSNTLATGQIRINAGQLLFDAGNNAAASNGASISRAIAGLAGATSATLTYAYTQNIDAGESVLVEFSADGTTFTTVQTITSASVNGTIPAFTATGPFTAGATLRFTTSAMNIDADVVSIDNISIAFTAPATTVNGDINANILIGDINGSIFNGRGGNDTILAGDGNDTINWSAGLISTDGRDFVDGGAGTLDHYVVAGNITDETFNVYARTDAIAAGFNNLMADTEIVVTRNGVVIGELDNIEEITINTGGGTDTVNAIGNFNPTSLNFNTITVNDDGGSVTVDASEMTSAHHVALHVSGYDDTFLGYRSQDEVIVNPLHAINGTSAANRIAGTSAGDLINAGLGNDTARGGFGDDTFVASANDGRDRYYGDVGNDTLDISAVMERIMINLNNGTAKVGTVTDRLDSIENVITGAGDDTITASKARNMIDTGAGHDTIVFMSADHADGDTIANFEAGDKIDVRAFMGGSITLVNGASASAAGQIAISYDEHGGQDVTLLNGIDAKGNHFEIDIKGHHIITGTDFST